MRQLMKTDTAEIFAAAIQGRPVAPLLADINDEGLEILEAKAKQFKAADQVKAPPKEAVQFANEVNEFMEAIGSSGRVGVPASRNTAVRVPRVGRVTAAIAEEVRKAVLGEMDRRF